MSMPALRFQGEAGRDFTEWKSAAIGDVLSIGSGKDYKHLSNGNIPVYGTGGYMLSVDKYLYDGESVCIGRKGTIDKPKLLTGKFWTVDTLFYTHSFKNCLPKFIYATFQRIDWKNYNEASGVPSLSKSTIEKIEISLPSIAEQTKIANFLTAIDEKITQLNQKHNLLTQYKKGVMQQVFRQELRFKDDDGGDFPDWSDEKLGKIGRVLMCKRILKEQTLPVGDVPFYKIGTFGKQADAYISNEVYKNYKGKFSFPKKGDILISAAGTIGRTVVYDGLPAYFQDSNIVWIDNNEELLKNSFLYYIYASVTWNTENTTIARLYNDNLKSISIAFPSTLEQTKITNFLTAIDDKITATQTQLQAMKQYKQGLLQQMFV